LFRHFACLGLFTSLGVFACLGFEPVRTLPLQDPSVSVYSLQLSVEFTVQSSKSCSLPSSLCSINLTTFVDRFLFKGSEVALTATLLLLVIGRAGSSTVLGEEFAIRGSLAAAMCSPIEKIGVAVLPYVH